MLFHPCGLCNNLFLRSNVGKTTQALTHRISEHRSTIRHNNKDYPAAVYFNDLKHNIDTHQVCSIEQVKPPQRCVYVWVFQ